MSKVFRNGLYVMVGFFELVFDNHLVFAIGAEDIEFEVTDLMLDCNAFKIAQADGVGEKREILTFGKPRSEVTGLVLPSIA